MGGITLVKGGPADAAGPSRLTIEDPRNDTSGGTSPQGDIVAFDLRYTDTEVILGTTLDAVVNPNSAAWTTNGSSASWLIDTNLAGDPEYGVRMLNSGTGPTARVTRLSDSTQVCPATPLFEDGARFLGARFAASCIGRPRQYRALAGVEFKPVGETPTTDVAPNGALSDALSVSLFTPLPALYRDGNIFRRTNYTSGPASGAPDFYGQTGDVPVSLDATTTHGSLKLAVARDTAQGKTWFVRTQVIGGSESVKPFQWGNNGDQPVAGDWNNDGVRTIGLFRPSSGDWFLTNNPDFAGGAADIVQRYGSPGDVPVVGDWNNDGFDTLGVYRNGNWYLTNFQNRDFADGVFFFGGSPLDVPVPADWNRDGTTTFGIFRQGLWLQTNFFDHGNVAENTFVFGQGGDIPFIETVSLP